MAKLSARGATVLAEFSKKYPADDDFPEGYTEKRALRSDRKLLRNTGSGWKVVGSLRDDLSPEQWVILRSATDGWNRTK